jgi:hypothetical protein
LPKKPISGTGRERAFGPHEKNAIANRLLKKHKKKPTLGGSVGFFHPPEEKVKREKNEERSECILCSLIKQTRLTEKSSFFFRVQWNFFSASA